MSKKSKKNTYTSENPYNVYAHGGLTDNFPMLLMQKNNNAYPANPGKPMNMGQFYPYGGMYSNPTLYQASNGYKPGSFAGGGFFDGVANYGRSMADIGLSTLGMPNVVRDDSYTGNSAQDFRNIAGTIGGITKMALPLAATAIGGPMAGMAVGAGQQMLGQVDKGLNQQPQQYPLGGEMMAYGKGGIHIKPSHKGRFTAYKKKTGKTTEEALHSKDPHVRQMANFARNAAKWKHADGGLQPQDFYNNWSKDQFIQLNAPYTYAMGGVNPGMANAEVEKQEVMRFPDGGTDQVDGPSHDNGGIPVNLPGGTQIFSDRLKASTGKTFAKEAEKFKNNKWDKIIDDKDNHDPLRTKTAEMMKAKNQKNLDAIFAEQESQKQQKAVKAFGKFMAKHGGTMPMYPWRGTGPAKPNYYNGPGSLMWDASNDQGQQIYNVPNSAQGNQQLFDNVNNGGSLNTNQNPSFNNIGQAQDIPFNNKLAGAAGTKWAQTKPEFEQRPGRFLNPENDINNQAQNQSFDKNTTLMSGIGLLGNSLAAGRYLGKYGNKYDKVNYGSVNPKLMDPTRALADIDRSSYGTQKAIPGATGGHGGQALNYLLANSTNRDQMKTRTAQDFENTNAGIANQFGQYNKGLEMQGMNDEARNKGQMLTNKYRALGAMGQNIAGQSRDIRAQNMDNYNVGMLGDYLNNYTLDPKTGKFIFRQG